MCGCPKIQDGFKRFVSFGFPSDYAKENGPFMFQQSLPLHVASAHNFLPSSHSMAKDYPKAKHMYGRSMEDLGTSILPRSGDFYPSAALPEPTSCYTEVQN